MTVDQSVVERATAAAGRTAGRAQALAELAVPGEERELVRRVLNLPLRKQLLLARRLWRDRRIGALARAPLAGGLVYAVLPIKLTPPVLGPLRRFEKVATLALLLWLLVRLAPRDVVRAHLDQVERPSRLPWRRSRPPARGRTARVQRRVQSAPWPACHGSAPAG